MKVYDFKSICIDDIPAMGDLLIYRQNLESEVFPFQKNSCLNTKYVTHMLKELFLDNKVIGIGAFDRNELMGYIIGEVRIDNLRGRHVWVPYEGIAVRGDQSTELIRNLYAKVSVAWLEQGCFMHHAIVPLGNQAYYEAFQRLSFFIEQVHGVIGVENFKPFESVSDAEVRLADKMDSEAMGRMFSIILSYQNSAPTFAPVFPEFAAKIKDGYKNTVEDDKSTVLIAIKDMRELGFQVYETISPELMVPDNGIELSIAGTCHSEMGSGVGKKLVNEGFRIMKEKGYNYVMTDWRIANLASSTFWPKCGFKPVAYRMVRCIDSNIAWANFNNPCIKSLQKP